MAKLPAQYVEGWAEENAIYRTARKTYRCEGSGSIPAKHADGCTGTVKPGEPYVEFVGETPAFQRGSAHSIACALHFEYIRLANSITMANGSSITFVESKTPDVLRGSETPDVLRGSD